MLHLWAWICVDIGAIEVLQLLLSPSPLSTCATVVGRSRPAHENGRCKSYSTRSATGSIKRRRYNTQFSSDNSSSDNSDTEEDTRTPLPAKTNNHIDDATSDSGTASESGDTTDIEVSPTTMTRYNMRTPESSHRTVNDRHLAVQTFRTSGSRQSQDSSGRAVMTRNQGRRTVRYGEDSDHDADHNSVTSDNDDSIPGLSVSSRGRIRRLTARAQAAMLADWGHVFRLQYLLTEATRSGCHVSWLRPWSQTTMNSCHVS